MARKPIQLSLAMASTLVGLALCYFIWESRPSGPSAVLNDSREEVEALIVDHLKSTGGSGGSDQGRDGDGLLSAVSSTKLPPLKRREVTEEEAKVLFSSLRLGGMAYDSHAYYWSKPNLDYARFFREHPDRSWKIRTNAQGFRKSTDVQEEKPDLRILFAGDSHTGGVVPEDENMVQVVEQLLAQSDPTKTVEALNAGHGGYNFYNYLGTLERNIDLNPDVFVVVGFGGNDFQGVTRLARYHNSLRMFKVERKLPKNARHRIQKLRTDILAQDLLQLMEFAESKDRMKAAEVATCQIMAEIKRQCDEAGIRLIYVHIPPSMDVQQQILGEFREPILEICELTEEELGLTDALTNRVLDYIEDLGIETIDMRPVYSATKQDCYWRSDYHINTLGHRLIGKALANRLLNN